MPVITESPAPSTQTTETVPLPLARGTSRVSGKFWKDEKKPFKRSHLNPSVKSKGHDYDLAQKTKEIATRKLLKELKEEREQADKAWKTKIVERRKAREEQERIEMMRKKMSEKKLLRMRKKAGRTKKINH
ncbi:hypothetical protein FRB99_000528 [Tulasnella sp. 403]|nr:hypothetical protein FRB99_000528 [Tulasnella sp. 403]